MTQREFDSLPFLKYVDDVCVRYKIISATTPLPGTVSVFATDAGKLNFEPVISLVLCEMYERPKTNFLVVEGPFMFLHCISGSVDAEDSCDLDGSCVNWLGIAPGSDDGCISSFQVSAERYAQKMAARNKEPTHEPA